METRKTEERKWDIELSTEIASRKRVCADRGVKLTVVLLTSRKMLGMRLSSMIYILWIVGRNN